MTLARRLLGPILLLVLALHPAAADAAAKKASASVKSVKTSARTLAPGGDIVAQVNLKVSGRGRAKPVKLGLILATGTKPKGGTALTGKPATARLGKKGAALFVSGTVPATLALDRSLRVLACIDPAKAIKKNPAKGGCAAAKGAVRIAAPAGLGSIDAALAAGKIDKATAILYRLYALAGDPRLPAQFATDLGDEDGHSAIIDAADSYPTLPPAVQKKVLPFFTTPATRNGAWAGKQGKRPKPRKRVQAAGIGPVNCQGFEGLSTPADLTNQHVGEWKSVASADGNSLVHYVAWTPVAEDPYGSLARDSTEANGAAKAAAQRFANEMPRIWDKLTPEFGVPMPDGDVRCFNGGDSRFDIYIDSSQILYANHPGASGLTLPYPQVGSFCTGRPSFVVIDRREEPWALAHEFMHALEFAHRYKSCAEPIAFWDEGVANWAADFVYKDVQREQIKAPHYLTLKNGLGNGVKGADYDWWPFWMMLQRTYGTGVLRDVFGAMANDQAIEAVDKAIPGGWNEQLPKFLIALYNQSPIGEQGFPISQSFRDWDNWSGTLASLPSDKTLGLNGRQEETITLENPQFSGDDPLELASIQKLTVGDDKIKEIRLKNAGFGKGGHVDAALHLKNGKWRLVNWSDQQYSTICRDREEENATELIVFSTTVDKTKTVAPTHEIRVKDACAPPRYKIDEVEYTDQLSLDGLIGFDQCPSPSTEQTNTGTLPVVPIGEPGGALSEPHFDGGPQTGLMHAIVTKTGTVSTHGCEVNSEGHYVPCNVLSSGSIPTVLAVDLELPPGDAPAKLTWHPTVISVGEFTPPPPNPCVGFYGDAQPFGAATVTTAPRSALLDAGPQRISVDLSGSAPSHGGNGIVHATSHYGFKFHRINEDGSDFTG